MGIPLFNARFGTVLAALLAFALACGCGGGSGQKLLFVLGLASPEVVLFHFNSSGVPQNPNNAAATGSGPRAMAITPSRQFAYVADSAGGIGNGAVSMYTLNPGAGLLTTVTSPSNNGTVPAGTPVPTQVNPVAMAIDSAGSFLFVANQGSNSISVFGIDTNTGALNEVKNSPFATASGPSALAITGTTLWVASAGTPGQIVAHTFDKNGALSSFAPAASGLTQPVSLTTDSRGQFLFVADVGANTVAVYSISSNKLSAVSGSPFPAGTGTAPVSLFLDPTGKFLYVANDVTPGSVSGFSVGSSGALSPITGSPFSTGTGAGGTSAVALDGSGKVLYAANRDGNTISVFTVDNMGALKANGTPVSSVANSPVFLVPLN